MNFDDFSYTENDRRYINPQVSLDEQNAFIDNLRNMQRTNTAQITQDTRNLGTQVPSNLGGLTGGTSYFTSRYQTPQMNSMVSDLRSTAQANALTTLMSNEVAKAQKRYNDAYRAAKKRAAKSGSGGGNTLKDLLGALGVDLTNDNNASDKYKTEESDEKAALLQKYQNELGPLKQTYENDLKKYNINGDRGSAWYDYLITPVYDYGNIGIRDAQAERKKRIDNLENLIKDLQSGK